MKQKHQATAESQNTHHLKRKVSTYAIHVVSDILFSVYWFPDLHTQLREARNWDWTEKVKWRQRAQVLIKNPNRHLSKRFRSGIPSDRLLKGCSDYSFPTFLTISRGVCLQEYSQDFICIRGKPYKLLGIIFRKVKAYFLLISCSSCFFEKVCIDRVLIQASCLLIIKCLSGYNWS